MKKLVTFSFLALFLLGGCSIPKTQAPSPETPPQKNLSVTPDPSPPSNPPISEISSGKRISLTPENSPPSFNVPDSLLVKQKLCNLAQFNSASPNTQVTYRDPERGLSFQLPYNEVWGNADFKVNPYDLIYSQVTTKTPESEPALAAVDSLQFGPLENRGQCEWARPYHLVFEPQETAEEVVKKIKENQEITLSQDPQIQTIAGLNVVRYSTRGVFLNPTLVVIGKKYNYNFYTENIDEENGFKMLEGIVKTLQLNA